MNVLSTRLAAIGVGAVLAAAAIGGCGGSDDSDSGSDALSKEEFIAQADQICADDQVSSDAQGEEFVAAFQAEDYEAAAAILEETTDTTGEAIDELQALVPPEEDQAKIEELFALAEEQQALVPDLVTAVEAGDQAAMNEVSDQGDAIDTQANEIADEYGLVDCGSAGETE